MTEAYFLTFCCWSEAYFIYDQTISIDSIRCVYIADCVYSTYFQVSVLTRACVKKYISNTTHTTLHTLHYTLHTLHALQYLSLLFVQSNESKNSSGLKLHLKHHTI